MKLLRSCLWITSKFFLKYLRIISPAASATLLPTSAKWLSSRGELWGAMALRRKALLLGIGDWERKWHCENIAIATLNLFASWLQWQLILNTQKTNEEFSTFPFVPFSLFLTFSALAILIIRTTPFQIYKQFFKSYFFPLFITCNVINLLEIIKMTEVLKRNKTPKSQNDMWFENQSGKHTNLLEIKLLV